MEPIKADKPGTDGDYVFQVKWDGVRMLAFYDGKKVTLQNRRLHDRTLQYPELHAIPDIVDKPVVLDGEIIVFNQDKPSFPAVMRRDAAGTIEQIRALQSSLPVFYMVFDLLHYGNNSLFQLPWEERNRLLHKILPRSHGPITAVDSFDDGRLLLAEIQSRGWEGIVAKLRRSPYIPGGKSRLWQKIKTRMRDKFLVGGYTMSGKTVNSLLVGTPYSQDLIYAGKVGTGLTQPEWRALTELLLSLQDRKTPFLNPPAAKSAVWVKPLLAAEIEFAEWTEDGRLRAPVIKSLSAENQR